MRFPWPYPLAALAAALLVTACSDDEAAPINVGPTGNPSIVISQPKPRAGASYACASIGDDADAKVWIHASVSELYLRPPGACGNFLQCGHLALYVVAENTVVDPDDPEKEIDVSTEVLNNESSVGAIPVLMRKLASRYFDGRPHAATGKPQLLTLRIDVVNDEGEIHVDHAGEPLSVGTSLVVLPDCSAASQ